MEKYPFLFLNEFLGIQGNYSDPRVTLVIDDAHRFVEQARRDKKIFDVIILDLTEPVGPSANVFTEAFVENITKLISPNGVILDSDSIFLSTQKGYFLQEESSGGENLFNVMRRTKLVSNIDMYRTYIPFFPGADFLFFLYSQEKVFHRKPCSEYIGKHYTPAIHEAAFVFPTWQKEWLGV